MQSGKLSRRHVLKGAGVALSLPWLETFAPRTARAQAAATKKRFVSLYFPNGTADFWHPTGSGTGDAWKLSPILEPALPIKPHLTVLQNVGQHPGLRKCSPNHSQLCAGMWTGVQPDLNPSVIRNATSVDQLIAQHLAKSPADATSLPSLQVGCSTLNSSPDSHHPSHSRSISWASPTEPLYKLVNPQAVFDRLVAGRSVPGGPGAPAADPAAERRRAQRKSVLDYVLEDARSVHPRLGTSDRRKVDQFLTSVRDLERRVADPAVQIVPSGAACTTPPRPPEAYAVASVPATYNRGKHVTIMTDLVAMALQCDITRVVSYMLDDARSNFAYTFLQLRQFTTAGSTPATTSVPDGNLRTGLAGYHGLQHAGNTNNGYATINHYMVQQATELALKLAAAPDGAGTSVLDNTVIVFGSGMHGGNHQGIDIPFTLIGGGGGVLKKNFFAIGPGDGFYVSDIHLTIMQKVFGMDIKSFGLSSTIQPAILA